jgi:hypothetical protein
MKLQRFTHRYLTVQTAGLPIQQKVQMARWSPHLICNSFDKMSILWNILKQLHAPVVTKLITSIHIRSYLLLKKTE